jgi:transcriptional regulator with XRE-family HTH domain
VEEIFRSLGRRIRELRIERGFKSQEDFADHCNLHRTFVGHLENGRKDFRLTTLIKVAGALGVTMAELFTPPESAPDPMKESSTVRPKSADILLRELTSLEIGIRRVKTIVSGKSKADSQASPHKGTTKRGSRKRSK